MKIYVAGASGEVDRVREVMQQLIDAGHTITLDWTDAIVRMRSKGYTAEDLFADECREIVAQDVRAIEKADALVFVVPLIERCRFAWFEVGVAAGLRKQVWFLGVRKLDTSAYYAGQHAFTVENLVERLGA